MLLLLTLLPAHAAPAPEGAEAAPGEAQLAEAERLAGEGNLDAALAAVREARRLAGEDAPWVVVDSWLVEGWLHLRRDDYATATASYKTVLDNYADYPQVPAAMERLAYAQLAGGDRAAARATYERLINDAPASLSRLQAEQALFDLLVRQGELAGAQARVAALHEAMPWYEGVPWLLLRLAQAQLAAGDATGAVAAIDGLRADYPRTEAAANARRTLVDALRQAGRADDALAVLEAAAGEAPEMVVLADIAFLRAEVLGEVDRADEAADVLGQLAARYPDTYVAALATLRRARLLQAAGDAGAADTVRALLDTYPEPYWRVQILDELVDLLGAAENWDDAEDAAAELAELTAGTPVGANALLRLATLQYAAERYRAARSTLEKIVQTYKGPPVVVLAEQMLTELPR